MKVGFAAKIGMLADGCGFGGMSWCLVGADECADAFAGQSADLDGAGGHRFGLHRGNCPIELQHTKAGSKALFWMRTAGQNGDDQPLSLRPDGCTPALEAFGRPFRVAAVRAGHMVGVGSVAGTAVTALVGSFAARGEILP